MRTSAGTGTAGTASAAPTSAAPTSATLAPRPPMGWNSWDCFGTTVTEDEVLANAEVLARRLVRNGFDTVVVDIDWQDQALETDSFSDAVASGGGGDEGFDFDRLEYAAGSLAEHLLNQLHGAPGQAGELARAIAEMLEETGYLTVAVADIADGADVASEPPQAVRSSVALLRAAAAPMNRRREREWAGRGTVGPFVGCAVRVAGRLRGRRRGSGSAR